MQELKSKLDSEFLAKAVVKLMKQDILARFLKVKQLSEEDQEFCDKIDWFPIDEMELKEEYVSKLKEIEKGPHSEITLDELDKLMDLK